MDRSETLPNGATIIGRFWCGSAFDCWVILASQPCGEGVEYVTWRADDDGNCWWGHYNNTLTDAVQNYTTRIAETIER